MPGTQVWEAKGWVLVMGRAQLFEEGCLERKATSLGSCPKASGAILWDRPSLCWLSQARSGGGYLPRLSAIFYRVNRAGLSGE